MMLARWPRCRIRLWVLPWLVAVVGTGSVHGQGPAVEYFYNPATTLDWAACSVRLGGGSAMRVPFLPVVLTDPQRSPAGSQKYTAAIDLDLPLVLVGSGFDGDYDRTFDGERIEVSGKAALLCYDCMPAAVEGDPPEADLTTRVLTATSRGASAVVVFTATDKLPFLYLDSARVGRSGTPVISISRATAGQILEAAGAGGGHTVERLAEPTDPPYSQELIARLRLRIDSAFERIETDDFEFLFRAGEIREEGVREVAGAHAAALSALRSILAGAGGSEWERTTTVYFGGFDSKVFFTHHWGWGLSGPSGVFLFWNGTDVDLGQIAHEQTHTFTRLNWGGSSSFLNEGVASYVEAMVTEPSANHETSLKNLERDALPELAAMLPIDVGSHELTRVAYPAAGSFVGYLIDRHGLKTLRAVFDLEGRSAEARRSLDSWQSALGRSVDELDASWRSWLRQGGFRKPSRR